LKTIIQISSKIWKQAYLGCNLYVKQTILQSDDDDDIHRCNKM